jgi:hypothetical protein
MRAPCPDCGGAVTTFESKHAGYPYGAVTRNWNHEFEGNKYNSATYVLLQCAGCGRGGLATLHADAVGRQAFDESFYPTCREVVPLPPGVADGVVAEYREAELCASVGGWRAASALLRFALEKTLRANGYTNGSLAQRINETAKEGVIYGCSATAGT